MKFNHEYTFVCVIKEESPAELCRSAGLSIVLPDGRPFEKRSMKSILKVKRAPATSVADHASRRERILQKALVRADLAYDYRNSCVDPF